MVRYSLLFLSFLTLNFNSISSFPYRSFLKKFTKKEARWNWNSLEDLDSIIFPENFIIGTADSGPQTEGTVSVDPETGKEIYQENSWTEWEKQTVNQTTPSFLKIALSSQPKKSGPRFSEDKRMGKACERWTRYKNNYDYEGNFQKGDIALEASLGMNAHRFSLEWSKIEPEKGKFNEKAMQHYIEYAQEMIKHRIMPIPTLWHHTIPLWFKYENSQERGYGFEDARNIEDFVNFAKYVFTAFKDAGLLEYTKLWLTFNEPVGFALAAYVDGKLPPGKKLSLKECGTVVKNMLDAHIAVFDALKQIDSSVKISFAHMMQPIQPYRPWNPFDYVFAHIFDYLINDVALEYFKTGNFYWLNINFPSINPLKWSFKMYTKTYNPQAKNKLDFIGVNYYTHTLLKNFKEAARPDEILADGYEVPKIKAIYPEGFYYSLKKASQLNIPILITENGFASNSDLRTEYLKKHLYVVYKAMQEGIDIRGYLFWTLTDCFGWNSGHHSNHGIFHVDFKTQKRTFRKNSQHLIDVIKDKLTGPAIEPLAPLLKD